MAGPDETAETRPTDPGEPGLLSDGPTGDGLTAGAETTIGPYRLLQKIGAGGMGQVWMAEQTAPIERRVALKLIKTGLDSKQVIARFEAERQALAMMAHPYVAKALDAGSTPAGQPYFVMELVQGLPITEYCDDHRLTTADRIALFRKVCEGVQHAHHRGVIHRDLKPSNVIVTTIDGEACPKVIDFGVAKSVAQKLTEHTLFTELGAPIGTPEYTSPEQVGPNLEGVDTRSDVYSLGVMLYELLIGARPFDREELLGGGWEAFFRHLREAEPMKPSDRISTLGAQSGESAKKRQVDASTLRRQVSGELDWIVMKAIDKDRERRYASPVDLAADLGRFLAHEPVEAGPPAASYRMRKFVRRHRLGVSVAAAAVVLLIGFAATMAVQRSRIAAARDQAEKERAAAERVATFLADGLGSLDAQAIGASLWREQRDRLADRARSRGASDEEIAAKADEWERITANLSRTTIARTLLGDQILAHFGARIASDLGDDPEIAGRLEYTISDSYGRQGLWDAAEPHARRAVELRLEALGPEHRDTLSAQNHLAGVLFSKGSIDEAEPLLRTTYETQARLLGAADEHTLNSAVGLAFMKLRRGRATEAESDLRAILETQRRVLGREHQETVSTMHLLAAVVSNQKRYAEAELLEREVLEIARRTLGKEHRVVIFTLHNLATELAALGRTDESLEVHRESLALRRRVLGDEHELTLHSWQQFGFVLTGSGAYDEGAATFREMMVKSGRALGRRHAQTLTAQAGLGEALIAAEKIPAALEVTGELLDIRRGMEHGDGYYLAMSLHGEALRHADRLDEATPLLEEAYAEVLARHPLDEPPAPWNAHPLAGPAAALAGLYLAKGERERCLEFLHELVVERGFALGGGATDRNLAQYRDDPAFREIFAVIGPPGPAP